MGMHFKFFFLKRNSTKKNKKKSLLSYFLFDEQVSKVVLSLLYTTRKRLPSSPRPRIRTCFIPNGVSFLFHEQIIQLNSHGELVRHCQCAGTYLVLPRASRLVQLRCARSARSFRCARSALRDARAVRSPLLLCSRCALEALALHARVRHCLLLKGFQKPR